MILGITPPTYSMPISRIKFSHSKINTILITVRVLYNMRDLFIHDLENANFN